MASFKILETQFQMFINSQIYLNDEYIVMTRNYFLEYTRLDILEFRDTLIQNIAIMLKSQLREDALHKMEFKYDSRRVNERLDEMTESKKVLIRDKAWDALNIRSISDEEPMAEGPFLNVQKTFDPSSRSSLASLGNDVFESTSVQD
ncbi:hypothetical protein Tco_1301486 [Tanacetum coccineum]